eukprot:TRINITY_DN38696_c1_g1_i3.p1 TRINITY_DN38696_c1_g1~~TRINITY_DN38696_c1_g1_i3.p1  ORF type:complete len:614 (-),score=39.56 TRINITY_DN38696_c1_g1_i3:1353-2960(-)
MRDPIMLPTRTQQLAGYPFTKDQMVLEDILSCQGKQQLNQDQINQIMALKPSEINRLFGKLERRELVWRALDIFRTIQRLGYKLNVMLYSKVMSMYSGDRFKYQVTLNLFQEMLDAGIEPDRISYNTVLLAALTGKDKLLSQELFQQMLAKENLFPDVVTYNMLMQETEDIAGAILLLKEMIEVGIQPNVYTYTTLMALHRRFDAQAEEQTIFKRMEMSGLKPDVISINQLISSCARQGEWEQAWALFTNMPAMGLKPTIRSYNSILAACYKCGKTERAFEIFRQLNTDKVRQINAGPSLVTYNTMIALCSKARRLKQAQILFDQLLDENLQPDAITVSSLITCYPAQKWLEGVQMFEYFTADLNVVPNVVAYNSLLTLLGKAGRWQRMVTLYKYMLSMDVQPDVYTYSALIKGCERCDQFYMAIQFFDELLDRNVRPNIYVFGAALTACERGSDWDKAVEVFNIMQYYGVELDTMKMFARKLIYAWPPLMSSLPKALVKTAQITIDSGRAVRRVAQQTIDSGRAARRWIDDKIQ